MGPDRRARRPGATNRGASPETRLARSTLGEYLGVRSGQPVVVEAWSHALPWARAFVVEARRRGAEPVLALEDEDGYFRSLLAGGTVPAAPPMLARTGAAYVYLGGPEAFPRLLGLRSADLAAALDRHGGAWRKAARAARVRGARVAIATVTSTAAARFGVNVDGWRAEVLAASVVPPYRLGRTAARALQRLGRARTMSVRHPNGSRLELELKSGRWVEETGRPAGAAHRADPVWTAVPTGKLLLAVRPASVRGTWEANRPNYERLGETAVALGARFEVRDGRPTDAGFDRGGEEFLAAIRRGGRRSVACAGISVGLNPRIGRAPEVGDLELGTVGLRFRVAARTVPAGAGSRECAFLLQGADVDLDGARWLVAGRRLRARS